MSLRVRRAPSVKYKLLTAMVAAFALVAQPMYGIVEGYVASAAVDTATIRYAAYNGDDNNGSNDCTASQKCKTLAQAVSKAQSGDTVQLIGNTYITEQVTIKKSITIDGNGRTIWSAVTRTGTGNNAAIGIQANGVVVKNLTINGTQSTGDVLGINIWKATGVGLYGITTVNNAAGVIVGNSSEATIDGVHTSGNRWYGINVDKTGAKLTIKGANTHQEAKHIVVGDTTPLGASLIDQDAQYAKLAHSPSGNYYVLDRTAPVVNIVSPSNDAYVSGTVNVSATLSDNVALNEGGFGIYPASAEVALADGNAHNELRLASAGWSKNDNIKSQIDGKQSITLTRELNTAELPAGDYLLRVGVNDKSGKRSNQIIKFTTIDRKDPTIQISQLVVSKDKKLSFNLKAVDNESGLDIIAANIYNADNTGDALIKLGSGSSTSPRLNEPYTGLPVGTTEFTKILSGIDVSGLESGEYTIRAFARDHANNERRFELVRFNVDNTAPTGSVVVTRDNNVATATLSVTGGPIEDLSSPWTRSGDTWTRTHTVNDKNATVEIEDLAGNKRTIEYVVEGLDKDAPSVDITGQVLNSDGTYTITGTTSSDTAQIKLVINGVSGTQTIIPNGTTWVYKTNLLLAGQYPVIAWGIDGFGNSSEGTLETYLLKVAGSSSRLIINTDVITPPRFTAPSTAPQTFAASQTDAADEDGAQNDSAILGAQTSKQSAAATPAIEATESGWKIFGLAWYWWVLILAAIAGLWWAIAGFRARQSEA